MNILAIETSCDETAVAVVKNGRQVLVSLIASQIAKHAETGGVVPEVAAREHMKIMMPLVERALQEVPQEDIDAIAVTSEPGLPGSLIVGRATGAALALAWNKPLLPVNHIHGHIYSSWLESEEEFEFPILLLTASGGHNELVLMHGHDDFELLGESLDDAAGEAYDKVARLLGLGYPGGPAIEKAALEGDPQRFRFPRAKVEGYNFSFSGLKTSVLYHIQEHESELENPDFVNDTAAAFQEAVLDSLVSRLLAAFKTFQPKSVHLVGGVSANMALRKTVEKTLGVTPKVPAKMAYCTDNAAMIASAAYFQKCL